MYLSLEKQGESAVIASCAMNFVSLYCTCDAGSSEECEFSLPKRLSYKA